MILRANRSLNLGIGPGRKTNRTIYVVAGSCRSFHGVVKRMTTQTDGHKDVSYIDMGGVIGPWKLESNLVVQIKATRTVFSSTVASFKRKPHSLNFMP